MIIIRTKTFSRPKGNEETEKQKEDRKKTVTNLAVSGTTVGGIGGLASVSGKTNKISKKTTGLINKSNEKLVNDMKHAEGWVNKVAPKLKASELPKFQKYVTERVNKRVDQNIRDIDRISKTGKRAINKVNLKGAGKGLAIGAAISVPAAVLLNKKMKKD